MRVPRRCSISERLHARTSLPVAEPRHPSRYPAPSRCQADRNSSTTRGFATDLHQVCPGLPVSPASPPSPPRYGQGLPGGQGSLGPRGAAWIGIASSRPKRPNCTGSFVRWMRASDDMGAIDTGADERGNLELCSGAGAGLQGSRSPKHHDSRCVRTRKLRRTS